MEPRAVPLMTTLVLCSLGALTAATGGGGAARLQPESPVKVDGGQLQGVAEDGIVSFKGIPFAAPPVGDLRWRPPQPAASGRACARQQNSERTACRDGSDHLRVRVPGPGAPPAQGTASAPTPTPPPPAAAPVVQVPSEDCLDLNVWRPADPNARKLPVMVWIYGGGFTGGSSSSPNTSGAQFAKQGVVLVAMNYRVGRFGFFAFPALSKERPDETKGNYAYMDQIAALQWVRRNIEVFGGDPDNVTIFGFSAGWRVGSQHAGVTDGTRSVPQGDCRVRWLERQRAHRPSDAHGRH